MKSSRSNHLLDQIKQIKLNRQDGHITVFCVTKYHDCTNVVSVMLSGSLSSSVVHLASQMLEPTEQPL